MRRVMLAMALGLPLVACGGSQAARPAGLRPSADTYVSARSPHGRFGLMHRLRIGARPTTRALLRFDLPARGRSIRHATLRVYPLTSSRAGFAVARVYSSWSEGRTTFRNRLRLGAASVRSGPLRRHRWKSVDVSRLLGSRSVLQIALVARTRRPIALSSREAGGLSPRLLTSGTGSAPGAPPGPGSPCGAAGKPPATYRHVIWIVFENQSYAGIIGNRRYPYTNQLARECGSPTNFWAERHPSLPNYIAMTSGSTQGITGDSSGMLAADNIYNQVKQSGRQWRHYAFGMPSPCDHSDSSNGIYTAHHEPPVFYSDIAADCRSWDVGVGAPGKVEDFTDVSSGPLAQALDSNTLPAFATLGPTDDGGNSSAGGEVDPVKGEAFLKRWIPRITSSAAYQAGTTAIFITWDEASDFNNNPPKEGIPTIVIAPTIPAGAKPSTRFDHYSMLRTTEEMLGIKHYLGAAAGAPSMRAALHL
jgi:phosphatidylinositol-3-phosphatase